jgi:hypothetical protein
MILLVRPRYNFARSSQNHSAGEDKITWSAEDHSAGGGSLGRRVTWLEADRRALIECPPLLPRYSPQKRTTRSSGGCIEISSAKITSSPNTSDTNHKTSRSSFCRWGNPCRSLAAKLSNHPIPPLRCRISWQCIAYPVQAFLEYTGAVLAFGIIRSHLRVVNFALSFKNGDSK